MRERHEAGDRLRAVEVAAEIERRALSADLHDSIGQLLPLARMKLAALRGVVPESESDRVDAVDHLLAEAEERVRTLVFRRSGAVLHDSGLTSAAEDLAQEMERYYGLCVSIHDDGRRKPLTDAQRIALFRGLREVLINVARHAKTDAARVRIERDDAYVCLQVEDRGAGFDPSVTGFGLRSISDRLAQLDGRLEIDSNVGEGARVRLIVPLRLPSRPESTADCSIELER